MVHGYVMWALWVPVAAVAGYRHRPRGRAGIWRTLGILFLVTYSFWIASVAFFPMPLHARSSPLFDINLVPFRHLWTSFTHLTAGQIVREHGGNLLLLVPFTLLGPPLWPRLRAWRWALVLGVGISAAIELLQLALSAAVGTAYRSVDINDVIFNAAGALLGYALFLLVRRVTARPSRLVER